MKKYLLFFAAMCWAMMASTFTAQATALSDGAVIWVGLEKMTHEDVEGWTPEGVNGPIVYDETNHVLTLSELAFTQQLDIDASAFWEDQFTIRIEGETATTFEVTAFHAIRFRGEHGLIIEGEAGTVLSITVHNSGSYGGCGIMCATTFSTSMAESDYLPLTIQGGVSVGVNNYGANEGKYAAVIAYPINIKSSDLSAVTTDGTGIEAVQTGKGVGGVTTYHSQWMNYDEYDNYFWEWKAYSVTYDVIVNGYHLNDRRSTLSSSDMTNIKNGALTYDPEKNVLELSSGFDLEAHDGVSSGIAYNGTEPLTIKLNSYSQVTISEKSMSGSKAALYAKGPVIIDLNGCDLELFSTYGSCLLIQNEVTIINSMGIGTPGDAEKKTLALNSPNGFGIIGDASDAKMTIDRTNVVAGGNNGSVIEIPTDLIHVELESGYHWNSMNSVVDEYDNEVADPMTPVHFNISAWQLTTTIWPEGAGRVDLTAGGETFGNRYYFSSDKDVEMTPVPNDGWDFMMWADMDKDDPRTVSVSPSTGSENYQADFVRLINSETQWYTIMEVGGKRSIFKLNDKLRTLGDKIADLTPTEERSIVCAAFAEGYLYYIETNSLGTKSWLVRAPFDGTTLGTPEVITDDAESANYSFFYTITYSSRDECFYAYCRRMSDSKNYYVQLSPENGAITEITEIASGYSIDGMVIDGNGILYSFYNSDELWAVDPTNLMTIMEIGKTDLYLPGANSTAMFYDSSSDELFVFDDDIFWLVNKTTAKVEPIWNLSALNTNCIFNIPERYTIHVEVESGYGTVWLPGDVKTGKFDKDAEIELNAKGNIGWKFDHWDDGNTDNPRSVTVTENKTFYATFVLDPNVTIYPIEIGGIPFYTDHLTQTKETNPAIKEGKAVYDPEKRTLTFDSDLEIEVADGEYGLSIADDGTGEPVLVTVNYGSGPVKISDKYSFGAAALSIQAPVILDINGVHMEISSDNGRAIEIESELTVRNSLYQIYALKVMASNGHGLYGTASDAKLIIDHCKVSAIGSLGSVYDIPLELKGVKFDETLFDWDESSHTMLDHGTTIPTSSEVEFTINEWRLIALPESEDRGSVTITEGETVLENPVMFTEDKTVTLTAVPAEGWKFFFWSNLTIENPQTLTLTPSMGSGNIVAYFAKKVNTETPWFAVTNSGSAYSINKYEDKFTKSDSKVADIPVSSGDKLLCSEYAVDAFYYITTTSSEDNFSMFKATFDGETLGSPKMLKDADYSYFGFKDMVYSNIDECFYGVCTESATGDEIWAKIALDGEVTRIAEMPMPAGTDIQAMTITNTGILYALVKPTSGYPELHTITFTESSVTMNKIGAMSNTALYGAYQTAIWYDNVSNELFHISIGVVWLTDPTTAALLPVEFAPSGKISRVFSIAPPVPTYTITVKVEEGQETWGSVSLPGGVTSAKFTENSNVTLTAKPAKGYLFKQWNDGSKDASHEVTVTEDKTYTASFEKDPNFTLYDVFIGEEQFYTGRLTMTKEDNSVIKNDGSVTFDPTTNTLSLNAVEIESPKAGINIGSADEGFDATIIVNGTCAVKSDPWWNGFQLHGKELSILKGGADNPKLTIEGTTVIHNADFEISGLTAVIQGSNWSIEGSQANKLIVMGANLTVKAASDATICNWKAVEYNYCSVSPADILDSEGKIRIYNDDVCDETNNQWTGDIVFTPWNKLTVLPVEEGTAHFTLKSDDYEFTDEGYFAEGAEITITPDVESGFTFARWTDDPNWKDQELAIPAKRTFTMPAGNKELQALLYFEAQSSARWYGVNNDKFVAFSLSDFGAEVDKASDAPVNPANVSAGDFLNGNWYVVDNTNVKAFNFASLDNGEPLDSELDEDFKFKAPADVFDFTINIARGEVFAVVGTKLYSASSLEEEQLEELGQLTYDDKPVTGVAIAADANGNIYILGAGTPGVLYTLGDIDDDKKIAHLDIVGDEDNGGKIGTDVVATPQSMAFDLSTDELLWGAADYLRIINTDDAKAHIAGDLNQSSGTQGVVKALHRMNKLTTVKVSIAEDQEARGEVRIGTSGNSKSKKFVEGTKVTITATPNSGYKFKYWLRKGSEDEITDAQYTFKAKGNKMEFVAYFSKSSQDIDEITNDQTTDKLLIDGQFYILRDGKLYNASGARVK